VREHRLYQADWLLRFYDFGVEELFPGQADSTANGSMSETLDLSVDPKLAWALRHREQFPVDLNRATYEQLIRVPGIGTRNARRLLRSRRWRSVRLADLARLRVPMRKVLPFIITIDYRTALTEPASERLHAALTQGSQRDLFAS